MTDKMLYTTIGYVFLFLNLFTTLHGSGIVGIAFGFVAAGCFIKALTINK